MGLDEFQRVPKSTHQPRISVGAYFWGWVSEKYLLKSNERRTVLRLSATPDVPLPSMRDIDVKNQPTTTEEKRGSEIKYTETQINGRTRRHERLI